MMMSFPVTHKFLRVMNDRNAMGIIIGPFVRFNIKYNLLSRQEFSQYCNRNLNILVSYS